MYRSGPRAHNLKEALPLLNAPLTAISLHQASRRKSARLAGPRGQGEGPDAQGRGGGQEEEADGTREEAHPVQLAVRQRRRRPGWTSRRAQLQSASYVNDAVYDRIVETTMAYIVERNKCVFKTLHCCCF